MNKYIFDTMIFNKILDRAINIDSILENSKVYVTHIQWDELNNTKNVERKNELVKVFKIVNPENIPTESAVYGVSRWDQAKWPKENNIYEKIKFELDRIKKDKNNIKDSLIAETAAKNQLILVTDDANLSKAAKIFGVKSKCSDDIMKINT